MDTIYGSPGTIGRSNRIAVIWSPEHTVSENTNDQSGPTVIERRSPRWDPELLTTALMGVTTYLISKLNGLQYVSHHLK